MPNSTTPLQGFSRLIKPSLISIVILQSLWIATPRSTLASDARASDTHASDTVLFTPPPDASAPRATWGTSRSSYNAEVSPFRERINRLTQRLFTPTQVALPQASDQFRNWCSSNYQMPIQAITPANNHGLTLASRPVIAMEIPDPQIQQVYLVIETEAGEFHSETALPVPEQREQGAVQFQLPQTAPELALNQNYRWTLIVRCGERLRPDAPLFSGWVMRTARSPEAEVLSTASPIEQATWLGERGYWYDMLPIVLNNLKDFED
ncbi:MAG: DUF928 domain-containing protein [Cyanobacteria bacterium P01_D01_bin.105]